MSDIEDNSTGRLKREFQEDESDHSDSDRSEKNERARFKRQAIDDMQDKSKEEDEMGDPSGLGLHGGNGAESFGLGSGSQTPDHDNADRSGRSASQELEEGDKVRAISIRSLVSTKEAGVIIGKQGRNVSWIRDQSGARVTISEMVPGAFERILTVMGPLDAVAKAYSLVAIKVLEENLGDPEEVPAPNTPTTSQNRVTVTTMRLLAPDARMGSIIGRGGTKIKEIQELSGARCNASEERLPMSTERAISITGVPDSIHIAVYKVGEILMEHQERATGTIPYKPVPVPRQPGAAPFSPGSAYVGAPMGNTGPPVPPPPPQFYPGPPPQVAGPGYNPKFPVPPPEYVPMPPMPGMGGMAPPGSQAQQIFIPNDMVGSIIGKGGSKINEIRQLSGSHIKIAEPHGNTNERLVTITGTPESNQMALYLLYSRLESEKGRAAH